MNYSNYRNNMPHYDSMIYNYDPMGINDYRVFQNSRTRIANTMPTMTGMPEDMFNQRPFIPDTEIPFEIDGDMPAVPRTPGMQMPQMPGMQQPGMPQMPRIPQMPPGDGNIYPSMPNLPGGMPPMTCEQLREMMRRMNCPMDGNVTNGTRPIVPPENGTATPPESKTKPTTPPASKTKPTAPPANSNK